MPSHDPPPASLEVSPATVEKSLVLAVTPWSTEHSIPTLPTSTVPSEQPRSAPTAPRTGKLKNTPGRNVLKTCCIHTIFYIRIL